MSRRRGLRRELVGFSMGVVAIVVVGAAFGVERLITDAVWAPLDAALGEEADTLGAIQEMARAEGVERAVARVASEGDLGTRKFVIIRSPDGRVLYRSGDVPAPLLEASTADEIGGMSTIRLGHHSFRIVRRFAPGAIYEIGVGVNDRLAILRRSRTAIGAAASLLLVILGSLVWNVTGRATAELDHVAEELEGIEAGSLGRRLENRRTLEVDRLVSVLNRLLARLEAAMGALRRFTADAAHEIRTPISALRVNLEVTLATSSSAEEYRNGITDALEQTERVSRMAEALLTLSAVEAADDVPGSTELVRLDVLLREVVENLAPLAETQGRDFKMSANRPVSVPGTASLLQRLFVNLIDNAFQHTAPRSAVEVSLREAEGCALVEVRDEGPGMSVDEARLAFERFHRGRAAMSGAGLGLALCREIVSRHRGAIELRSSPEGGTSVVVTLPSESEANDGSRQERDSRRDQG